jgi:hypothetical protein
MLQDEIVFTKHANERLAQRKITREMVISTIEIPEKYFVEGDGNTKFISTVDGRTLHVVCQPLVEERKWLVKTVWVRGEDDAGRVVAPRKRYNRNKQDSSSNLYWVVMLTIIILILWYLYSTGMIRF